MTTKNPWEFAEVDSGRVERNPYLKTPKTPPPPPPPPPDLKQKLEGDYILMPQTNTYSLGVHALQEACKEENNTAHPQFTKDNGSEIYRPLTFREIVEAKVNDYESHDKNDNERKRLWNRWIDSGSGIAYKAKSTKFKFVRECVPLITIGKDFSDEFLPESYSSLQGVELDRGKKGVTYNAWLLYNKVEEHEGWRTALENDLHLLQALRDITWSENGEPETLMGFWVLPNTDEDQLQSLFVNGLYDSSDANGVDDLSRSRSFLRVAQPKPQ